MGSFQVLQRRGESVPTMSAWTEGVARMLPKSDLVALLRLDGSGNCAKR